MKKGYFVISLDFEIYWGMRDVVEIDQYKENLLGVRKAIPAMLQLFSAFDINATFATVGFLFFTSKDELLNNLPDKIPVYTNADLSPFTDNFTKVGRNEEEDPYHFAPSLIKEIKDHGQEIGCHTFSHYYCLEEGQTLEDFKADIMAAKKVAAKNNISLQSFIFPRNQYNQSYLEICKQEGITSFRGNERSGLFSSKNYGSSTALRRPFRLMDAYFNVSGHNCYSVEEMNSSVIINIPSSRFLRPYSKKLAFLDALRLKRITKSMTYAAKNGLCYHLWWHPHNFGINLQENINFLQKILRHFNTLKEKYDFQSTSMKDLTEKIKNEN